MHTIFYSWQSDLPSKYNRNFIQECLKKSLGNLNKSNDYIIELNLDRDTLGEPGTPDIVDTIFKKIANSSIFVCDTTIINQNTNSKKTPNPNVLLELGYAASVLGWENVVCVYNTAYGKVEDLPFDLKLRRPLQYEYNENKLKNKEALVKQLELAIKYANPLLVEEKKKIKKNFSNESSKALKIAIDKPDYWEYKLTEELFLSKLERVNSKYLDIKNGVLFLKRKQLKATDFLEFVEDECSNIINTISALTIVFQKELISSFGVPGVTGNALAILEVVNKIFKLIDNFLEWELSIQSVGVSEKMDEIKQLMLGLSEKIVVDVNLIPEQLRQVYLYPERQKVHKLMINLELGINGGKIIELLQFYSKFPHLMVEK